MKYKIIIFLSTVLFASLSCGDTPVFTEMATNRLKVVLKGTFETEETSKFHAMTSYGPGSLQIEDDSVDDVKNSSEDELPDTFMIDIAEIRLDSDKFANYRTTIKTTLSDNEPLFNGKGVTLKNDDPGDGHYDKVRLYVRKMIFDNANIYRSGGNTLVYDQPAEVIFHENDTYGFDFNQLQVNSYWDSLRIESGSYLRIFPVEIPIIGGLDYNKNDNETVLEIRLVIKNFIKKYEYDYYDEGVFKVCHYYAFSDWLRDVRAGESDIGRNVLAVARAYVPDKARRVEVTTTGDYVIAIPSSDNINDYTIPKKGSQLRTDNPCDLPQPPSYPGAYIEAVLDYYLKYEKYKSDFNAKVSGVSGVSGCPDFDTYSKKWDDYEAKVEKFKIPPYAGSSSGGKVVFSNMAPGSYNFYWANQPAYGELFTDGAFTQIESTVDVTEGSSTLTVPE